MIKNKNYFLVILCILGMCMAGCGKKENAEEVISSSVNMGEDVSAKESGEKDASLKQIKIYYWGTIGNQPEQEMISIDNFEEHDVKCVSRILGALATHNIVSLDSKVRGFEIKEDEKGKKILHLDLNKAYAEYLSTMGKRGEQILLVSLADTFLDAWEADEIFVTAQGQFLKTEHGVYQSSFLWTDPQLLREGERISEQVAYDFGEEKLPDRENITCDITYPVFQNMEDGARENTMNALIKEFAERLFIAEGVVDAKGTYETYELGNDVYVLLKGVTCGEQKEYETKKCMSLHFDLKTGTLKQLKDMTDTAEIARKLREFEDCILLSEGMDEEQFGKMLEERYPDLEMALEQFDINQVLGALSLPAGYSYGTGQGWVLIFPLYREQKDYVEVFVKQN